MGAPISVMCQGLGQYFRSGNQGGPQFGSSRHHGLMFALADKVSEHNMMRAFVLVKFSADFLCSPAWGNSLQSDEIVSDMLSQASSFSQVVLHHALKSSATA